MNNLEYNKFEFTSENIKKINNFKSKYPEGKEQSAIIATLDLAQRQNKGWLSKEAIEASATILNVPSIKAYEVASFYSMFNLKPVGKYHIQVCGTTPCWLRGSEELFKLFKEKYKIDKGDTTEDQLFTISEVECLGACVNAPMVQINDDYYEDLNRELFEQILNKLVDNDIVRIGSQIGRKGSEPFNNIIQDNENA